MSAASATYGDAAAWATKLVTGNPELFRLVHDFNLRPANWVETSRLSELPNAAVANGLLQNGHGYAEVHAWAATALKLDQQPACWDFAEPRRRIALLGHETLQRLAIFCGSALCWNRISTIIGKSQIAELKGAIGEHAYAFALRRGRMVVPQPLPTPVGDNSTLNELIHTQGWRLLLGTMAGEAAAIMSRVSLKLPRHIDVPDEAANPPEGRDSAWSRVRKILPEVLNREELRCFA